jgi:hypothetical protein
VGNGTAVRQTRVGQGHSPTHPHNEPSLEGHEGTIKWQEKNERRNKTEVKKINMAE